MGFQPPFRMPCGGVPGVPRRYLGGTFNGKKSADVGIARYVNNTTVRNRDDTADVSPYQRYALTSDAADSCEDQGDPIDYTGWPLPFAANTWEQSGTVDFSSCKKRGWKAVQAGRNWHGRIGYKNAEDAGSSDTVVGCTGASGTPPEFVFYRSKQLTPSSVRYCSLAMTAEHKITSYTYPGGVQTPSVSDHTASGTLTIGPTTGRWVASSTSFSPNAILTNRALGQISKANWYLNNFIARCSPSAAGTVSWTGGSFTVTQVIGGSDRLVEQVAFDISAGTLTRDMWFWKNISGTWTQYPTLHEVISITDSALSIYSKQTDYDISVLPAHNPDSETEITVTGTLGDENDAADILADAKFLLSKWDLTDDPLYPWRTDPFLSAAPLVSRDERPGKNFDSIAWYVADYGHPLGAFTPPSTDWEFDAQILVQTDWAFGEAYVTWTGDVSDGDDMSAISVTSGNVIAPTTYTIAGGSLPPGVTLNASTGAFIGSVSAGGGGRYAVTVLVEGAEVLNGTLLGVPKPPGYQNFFDFGFADYRGCCHTSIDTGDKDYDPYGYAFGQDVVTFNSQNNTQIPLNATQWSNRWSIINNPPGAWIMFADKTNITHGGCPTNTFVDPFLAAKQHTLTMCKYAEILDGWHSQNFARPAGADKFLLDETAVYGVGDDYDGTNFTPKQWAGSSIADATISDTSGIWGGSSVGGFYEITFSGGKVHLGTKIFDIPTGWVSASGDSDVAFGRLRLSTAPALLGKVAVTYSGTTCTFAAAQPSFGMTTATHQEQVDVLDADLNVLASDATATRVDDNSFTTAVGYPTGVWVMIHGAASWYVNDADPKGDFVMLSWEHDKRSAQEYLRLTGTVDCDGTQVSRPSENLGTGPLDCLFQKFTQNQHCLPFVPCNPKVACFSPNDETFPNGVTEGFPADDAFALDDIYGSLWQGFVVSTVNDLLWQVPHKPFSFDGDIGTFDPSVDSIAWSMDDVSCKEDSIVVSAHVLYLLYYQHAPQVEARIDIPDNYGPGQDEFAPALPSGVTIGFVSPVTDTSGQQPPGYLGFNDDFSPAGTDTAWQLHKRFCDAPTNVTCTQFDYTNSVEQC